MKELVLEGNLGEKHKRFNVLVNETVTNEVPFESILSEFANSDVDNLFKIDIASHYRNEDYIIKVLKCEDMLYVSRAIKKCPWLITDQQYAHLINPQYLHTDLFPHMTTKAINKLMLHIRLYLKDERRVEDFFKYLEIIDVKQSLKWLPYCSHTTVEETVVKHASLINHKLFKKIYERHPLIFEIFIVKKRKCEYKPYLKSVVHILKTDANKYLDKLESLDGYYWPEFSKKSTAHIMKNCPDRVFNKMFEYLFNLNLETLAKHIEPEKTEEIILSILKTPCLGYWFTFKNIRFFIKQMPREKKFAFLKKVFIDKVDIGTENIFIREDNQQDSLKSENIYQWYEHAPFSIAFPYLKKMIERVPHPDDRTNILKVMLTAARRDAGSILKVLKYFHKNHINETFKLKISFINSFLQVSNAHQYDDVSWKLLDELFRSAEVYSNSKNDVQNCVEVIIVYNIINGKKIEEVIKRKFQFNSLKRYRTQLSESERDELFKFLVNYVQNKIDNQTIHDQDDVNKVYSLLENILDLLKDWDKDLCNYEKIIKTIKVLISLKFERGMIVNLENIYNKNKAWRKNLFEDSILLSHKDQVFLNALKHDSDLFLRHRKPVESIRHEEILYRFLSKLRIYWLKTLAQDWAKAYYNDLKKLNNNKVVIQSIFTLLPIEELSKIVNKYTPVNTHIFWNKIDNESLAYIKNFGHFMHVVRPQPSPDLIFRYAIGDYTQFAMPSLNAIFYNMSSYRFREYLPQLISGNLTIQKLGVHIAFEKLKTDELCAIFDHMWESSRDASLRASIFKKSFNLLCRQKNPNNIDKVWILVESFIDNLTDKENPSIYKCLGLVEEAPNYIQTKFAVKSYIFLKSLPARCNCQIVIEKVALSTANLMDTIDPDFVVDIILDFIDTWVLTKKIFNSHLHYPNSIIEIVSNYILNVSTELQQNYRYDKAIKPWLTSILEVWHEIVNENNAAAVEDYIKIFLKTLLRKARLNSLKKKYISANLIFKLIQLEIETCLTFDKTYFIITFCKLSAAYFQCFEKIKTQLSDVNINSEEDVRIKHVEMWAKIAPFYAAESVTILKEDIDKLFSITVFDFGKCLSTVVEETKKDIEDLYFEQELIRDKSCILGYLLAIKILPIWEWDCNKVMYLEIRKQISSHPSLEVRIPYYRRFRFVPIPAGINK